MHGIWHCDCDKRTPADKFQVKNGGKNHGRWFFVCQKPQPKRCDFFLWADDAKFREESAVLNNSRSEPQAVPQPQQQPQQVSAAPPETPKKQQKLSSMLTPHSKPRSPVKPSSPGTVTADSDDDNYGWSSSADEDLAEVMKLVSDDEDLVTSPRKAPRTPLFTSPGKRQLHEKQPQNENGTSSTWLRNDDVFLTPSTSTKSDPNISPSRSENVTSTRTAQIGGTERIANQPPSTLATDALRILSPVSPKLPKETERELIDLLNRHELRSQGIAKGRDITRVAVQSKDREIAELKARITTLESEKETSRTVIAHLKQDIANSPQKPRRSRPESSKPAV